MHAFQYPDLDGCIWMDTSIRDIGLRYKTNSREEEDDVKVKSDFEQTICWGSPSAAPAGILIAMMTR